MKISKYISEFVKNSKIKHNARHFGHESFWHFRGVCRRTRGSFRHLRWSFFEDRRRFFFHKATKFTISFITDVFKDPKYCMLLCFKFYICDKFCDGIWSKNWKPEKEPSRFLSNSDNGFEQSTSNLVWICPMNVNLDYQGIAVPAVTFFELFNKNNFSLHINTDKLTLYRIIKITLHNLKGRRQSI